MTDEFKSISAENQSSTEDDFNADLDEQQQITLSTDGEFAFEADTSNKGFSLSALWQNLRRAFLPTPKERAAQHNRRISRLSSAIEFSPDAPTNYVLRGELYMEIGDYASAVVDFRRALELATAQVENEDWGIIAQTMQDRAQEGLAEAQRHTL